MLLGESSLVQANEGTDIGEQEAGTENDSPKNYKSQLFTQLSTAEQGDDGMPTGRNVMAKSDCRKLASAVLKKEKGFSDEEDENYLKQNFNRIWKSHDHSED